METSSIRWQKRRIDTVETSSPVAAVVNRYPGCLICIHPGTRASQRLERYSNGGGDSLALFVYLFVYLFVTPSLPSLCPLRPLALSLHDPSLSPSSFLLPPFSYLLLRFHRGFPLRRSPLIRRIVGGAACPILRAFAGDTFGIGDAARLGVVAWWLLLPLCSSRGVTAHLVANRDRERERLAPGLSFRVTRVTRVP